MKRLFFKFIRWLILKAFEDGDIVRIKDGIVFTKGSLYFDGLLGFSGTGWFDVPSKEFEKIVKEGKL